MESHVLNRYQCPRYRSIGRRLRSSGSLSEETETSPAYRQPAQYRWDTNQTVNMTRSQETSSDEEENIEVQEINYDDSFEEQPEQRIIEEQILIEGDDYDVIQVYAVDPDLDLVASSDDEEHEDFSINNSTGDDVSQEISEEECLAVEENPHRKAVHESDGIDGLNFDLDTPVVSNVDDYFIKQDKHKNILDVKDEPVVNDVDEYFIKEENPRTPNVDDFYINDRLLDEEEISKPINVDEFFVSNVKPPENIEQNTIGQNIKDQNVGNVEKPVTETDLKAQRDIETLKRYLLEDTPHSNIKNVHRSYSLPQSPMHNICLLDDSKTCLSFEDLNLDLSDLTFENEKDKSASSAKSDDIPRTLTDDDVNSFLITDPIKAENHIVKPPESIIENQITNPPEAIIENNNVKPPKLILENHIVNPQESIIETHIDKPPEQILESDLDLSHQDMEIEHPVESTIVPVIVPPVKTPVKIQHNMKTSTPIKSTVLNFCIEKSSIKKENTDVKIEIDDFVDVESCNDTVIPVLEANNLNSLLEQFEATEKLNTKHKKVIKPEDQKVKSNSLTNGMRLQDAGVQLNKTKMRQILMPSAANAAVRRSPSPVHSDHDYCSSKKRYSLPNIKGGQSLLKPEVLSSNNRILSSRHRSCKNKKVVYAALSSDDESEKNNKANKCSDDINIDIKGKKISLKQTVKVLPQPARKKLSPVHSEPKDFKYKDNNDNTNNSVIVNDACKASDTPCSQNSNGRIKLTIKNKSEVILNCDVKDSQKDRSIDKCKSSEKEKTENKKLETQNNIKNNKNIKKLKVDSTIKNVSVVENCTSVVKEEARPKEEHFYTALFSNKQDVQIPRAMQIKSEKRSFEEEMSIATQPNKDTEQPPKKKKLNFQEYKLRTASSNNSSAAVSPESIFPDMPNTLNIDKTQKSTPNQSPPNGVTNTANQADTEASKTFFDPIREASRKILMNTKKKHKAEAMRKRDEDIVMSKIPKVENLQLQPLISDAEMMKIVGMSQPMPMSVVEKPQVPANIEEIVLVSIGVNTDKAVFKELERSERVKQLKSPTDSKSLINFKIKKSDHVLKQNVFDSVRRDKKSPVDDRKHEPKIDKERFKDITATLKSVKRQVDTKNYSNSLFASIQDVVKKKAPEEEKVTQHKNDKRESKSNSPKRKAPVVKPKIVRAYDEKADHGEDKIILYLGRDRVKPESANIIIQTDPNPDFDVLPAKPALKPAPKPAESKNDRKTKTPTPPRKRNDSDMSMSSDDSPVPKASPKQLEKPKERRSREVRSPSKEKRSRSQERYEKYRRTRSRSRSRSRRRRRSHSRSRSRSRSRGRFKRYRRSDSPYRRKRRSRSPYRRRSPSRREYRTNRSKSRNGDARSKTPKKWSPPPINERKPAKSLTPPPPRKPTSSESSDSSTSSSSSSSTSSSSSSSSGDSRKSRGSSSSYRRDDFRMEYRSSYSSEDRESNTPVEERRIVFVGKLEKDITKSSLRSQFTKFGPVIEVRLHSKEDGTRYGFVTFKHAHDAWTAVEAAATFPQYDVGFGGRRAFCRQSYADLDGLEAKYTEIAFHGSVALPPRRDHDISFEQMLLEMKKTLSQRKCDKDVNKA